MKKMQSSITPFLPQRLDTQTCKHNTGGSHVPRDLEFNCASMQTASSRHGKKSGSSLAKTDCHPT